MLKLRPMGAECDRPPGPLAPHRSVLPHGPRMPCAFCLTLALGARRPCPRPCPCPCRTRLSRLEPQLTCVFCSFSLCSHLLLPGDSTYQQSHVRPATALWRQLTQPQQPRRWPRPNAPKIPLPVTLQHPATFTLPAPAPNCSSHARTTITTTATAAKTPETEPESKSESESGSYCS